MKMCRVRLTALLPTFAGLLLLPSFATAAPLIAGVDGTVANGRSVKITGSGFGQHPDYNGNKDFLVRVWDNIEAGKVDSSMLVSGSGPELVVGGPNQRANSEYCGKGYRYATPHTYTSITGESKTTADAYQIGHYTSGRKVVFISGWFLFPVGFGEGITYQEGDRDQSKFLMISPPDDQPKTYFSVSAWYEQTGILRFVTEEGLIGVNYDTVQNLVGEGNWARFDIFSDISGIYTGGRHRARFYINGKLGMSREYDESFCSGYPSLDGRGCVQDFTKFLWLGYFFAGDDTQTWPIYVDDMFMDFTQARVELSERATWDETVQTHKELQIPTAWSSTSITFRVNMGAFQEGQQAYLYVVDQNGSVNAQGYPVRGSDAISAPKGLQVREQP